jgi:hypothetical protein
MRSFSSGLPVTNGLPFCRPAGPCLPCSYRRHVVAVESGTTCQLYMNCCLFLFSLCFTDCMYVIVFLQASRRMFSCLCLRNSFACWNVSTFSFVFLFGCVQLCGLFQLPLWVILLCGRSYYGGPHHSSSSSYEATWFLLRQGTWSNPQFRLTVVAPAVDFFAKGRNNRGYQLLHQGHGIHLAFLRRWGQLVGPLML